MCILTVKLIDSGVIASVVSSWRMRIIFEKMVVTFAKNLKKYFQEYCRCTSIHGFRYFGEKRTYFDLGWWLIVFSVCLYFCGSFITMVYQKWENSPVIVSFATRETPIHEIPFPAVTICPEIKAIKEMYDHSKMVVKLKNKERLTKEEYESTSYMDLLCDVNITKELFRYENDSEFSYFNNYYYADNRFYDFMFDVAPNLIGNFFLCKWMNRFHDCRDMFSLILTDEGLCATFNMMDKSTIYSNDVFLPEIPFTSRSPPTNVTWSLDRGYENDQNINTYPRRALFSGAKNSLTIFFQEFKANADPTCKMSLQGFKVILHTPTRVPRPSQQYIRLPLNEVVVAAVQPVMITTTKTVKFFRPEIRECYFETEKVLRFFKTYTQRNCQLECLTNFTLDWCECVGFYMPRTNGTPICGSFNKMCMEEAEEMLQMGNLRHALGLKRRKKKDSNSTEEFVIEEMSDCDCLPLCTDLQYNVETSSSSWDWKSFIRVLMENKTMVDEMLDETGMTMSRLVIYFKHNQFVTSRRHELYGPTDFLGNFGGLLGLFTGFSILSLMEIIYFLTVRIICNFKLYGNWSGNKKKE